MARPKSFPKFWKFFQITFPNHLQHLGPVSGARSGTVADFRFRKCHPRIPPNVHIMHTCTRFSTFPGSERALDASSSRMARASLAWTGILQPWTWAPGQAGNPRRGDRQPQFGKESGIFQNLEESAGSAIWENVGNYNISRQLVKYTMYVYRTNVGFHLISMGFTSVL